MSDITFTKAQATEIRKGLATIVNKANFEMTVIEMNDFMKQLQLIQQLPKLVDSHIMELESVTHEDEGSTE